MDKPEALRLADALDAHQFDEPHATAAELRRLARVEAQRDALLEALKEVLAWGTDQNYVRAKAACDKARAAIKAVEETK